jgi:MATE family multidrug resistance protein
MTAAASQPAPSASSLGREARDLARLAVPLAAAQLGTHLMGFVDTVIAGHLGDRELAGTGLGSSLFFAVSVIGMGVVLGLDPLASQAFGGGRPRLARKCLWQGLYAAGLVTLPLTAIALGLAFALPRFGVVPATAAAARVYVIARIPSLYFLLAAYAARAYLQAAHRARPVLVVTIVVNVVNALLGFVLAFGDRGLALVGLPGVGLPSLGVVGLGVGAALATVGQLVLMALAVRGLPPGVGDEPLHRLDRAVVRRILDLGLPIGLMMSAEVGVFSLVQVLMGGMGVVAGAAHQAAVTFWSLSFSVTVGIGAATSVQVGRAIGRGDAHATRRAGVLGIVMGAAFMLLPGAVMAIAPQALARLVTGESDVVPLAATLLRIAAGFQLVDGMQAVAAGALRGAGITRWAFVANVIAHWTVGLPVGVALAYGLSLGPAGLWYGLTTGLALVAAALTTKFVRATRGRIAALG